MTSLNNIIKRAMSLMRAHVQYSQTLAVEFADLIKDYEELVEAPEDIVPEVQEVQEEVDLEAVCAVFEELMENEPIAVLRALRPNGVDKNAEEVVNELEAVEQSNEDLITNNLVEETHPLCGEELVNRRFIRIKKPQLPVSSKDVKSFPGGNCHRRVNSRKKKFECSICDKSFSFKSHLGKHTRFHAEMKSFECSICGYVFSLKSSLEAHTRIHTGEKPFECTICCKWFRVESSLKKHTRSTH